MADTLALDFPSLSEVVAELRSLPPTRCADPFGLMAALNDRPARRGTVEKRRLKFQPIPRKTVTAWAYKLAAWDVVRKYPGNGRAVRAIFNALRDLTDWKTGRLDPAGTVIAKWAGYKPATFWNVLKWMRAHNILAVIPCCRKIVADDGRFFLQQETNVYVFLPPSQWHGYVAKEPPPPEPDTWGAAPKVPELIEQAKDAMEAGASVRERLALAEIELAALQASSDPDARQQVYYVQLRIDKLRAQIPPDPD